MKTNNWLLLSLLLVFPFFYVNAQLAHWPLENNASDASGNSFDGTYIGSPTFTTDKREGMHAIELDGSQAINLGNPAFPSGNSPRTITAWAKTNTTSGDHMIFAYGTTSNSQAMFIGQQSQNLFAGAWSNNFAVSGFWTTGVWHHICLTYDGSTARLYADGVEVAAQAKVWNLVLSGAFIGKHINNTSFWNGLIDDVRIYDRALTANEVLDLATLPPAAPGTLTASLLQSGFVELGWNDQSTDETGFQIERRSGSGSYGAIFTTGANVTSHEDQSISSGTEYFYRVRAVNNGGYSSYSNEVSMTIPLDTIADPYDLTATAISATIVNLAWSEDTENESGFEIQRSLTSGTGFTVIGTADQDEVYYTDETLSASTMYYYRVRTISGASFSGYSNEASVTTFMPGPSNPSGLTATALSDNSIGLSWVDNSNNETGFEVIRSLSSGTGFLSVGTVQAGQTSYTDNALTAGTTYYYKVRAINEGGYSAFTSEESATTSISGAAVPTGLTANAVSATSISLSWTDESINESGFQVERSLEANSNFTLVETTDVNAISFLDETLSPSTTYFYRVRAMNQGANSAFTAVATATTPMATPAPPTALVVNAESPTSVNLQWKDNSEDETEFEIERSVTLGSNFSLIGTVSSNTVYYLDGNLASGSTYYYRVRAVNTGGASLYTAVGSAILDVENSNGRCENIFCDEEGGVGIGTSNVPAGFRMAVNGKVIAEGVKVELQSNWPDYVFDEGYPLTNIDSLKGFIQNNGHLPNMPPASTVEKEGIDIEKINVLLVEKIEEMSLYLIQMEERIKILEEENSLLKESPTKN